MVCSAARLLKGNRSKRARKRHQTAASGSSSSNGTSPDSGASQPTSVLGAAFREFRAHTVNDYHEYVSTGKGGW